jgi:hypothetical protein
MGLWPGRTESSPIFPLGDSNAAGISPGHWPVGSVRAALENEHGIILRGRSGNHRKEDYAVTHEDSAREWTPELAIAWHENQQTAEAGGPTLSLAALVA